MAKRIVLVTAESPLLKHSSTTVLARYPSGEVLVQTSAPATEAVRSVPSVHGLLLSGVDAAAMRTARDAPLPEAARPILAYVELAGPVVPEWLDELRQLGVEPRRFQPISSYLCRGTGPAFSRVKQLPFVVSVTPLVSALKPAPNLPESGRQDVWCVFDPSVNVDEVVEAIVSIDGCEATAQGVDRTPDQVRVPATVTSSAAIERLRALPLLLSIEKRIPPRLEDEVADLIIAGEYDHVGRPQGSYLRWLEDHGISGRGITIGINDNGVDESHEAFTGRITTLDLGREWHGTFVAGHAAGNYLGELDSDGFIYGVGVAPGAGIISQDNSDPASTSCRETVQSLSPAGDPGSIQNNSWGTGEHDPMDYRSEEASYDRLVRSADPTATEGRPLTICFSAGNSGSAGLTRPKAAKNVIVTGNSENMRPSVGGSESDDINHVYTGSHASSHGNCGDGRVRPHVVAPGEWTSAANFGVTPGQVEYISDRLTWGGGTSGASPKTAGACALLMQWWRNNNAGVDPSPALLRALIVNGAEDTGFAGPIPNSQQGWGRLNLANILSDDVHHVYVDQSVLLRMRGEERRWRLRVTDSSMPVRITLAWTDPPGGINTGTRDVPAVVNFLGLRVVSNVETFYGNNFLDGTSRAGPLTDPTREGWDNLQNVYLPPGRSGTIEVIVRGINITTNCLNPGSGPPQQDFALVITNAFLDNGTNPSAMFLLVDDTTPGSSSTFSDDSDSNSDDDEWDDVDDRMSRSASERPTLRRGDRGEDVRDLQGLLLELNLLHGTVDGIFGSGTQSAVIAFQRERGLDPDGIVGQATWAALLGSAGGGRPRASDPQPDPIPLPYPDPSASRPTLREGARGTDVHDLQRMLVDTGHLSGRVDGIFGSGTRTAVVAFQRDRNLSVDGVVGPATWAALMTETQDEHSPSSLDTGNEGGDGRGEDDDWWGEETRPRAETTLGRPGADSHRVAEALLRGVGLSGRENVAAVNHEVLRRPPSPPHTETAGTPPHALLVREIPGMSAVESGGAPAFVGVGSIGETLALLMKRWDEFGTDSSGNPRRRVAVIVVGASSRITEAELQALRRIALHGDLYLVGSSEVMLSDLVQRMHITRGVHVRLAATGELALTARRTAAEATGARGLALQVTTRVSGERTTEIQVGFDLTREDNRVVLEIPMAADADVRIKPPATAPSTLARFGTNAGVNVRHESGRLVIEMQRGEKAWSGSWELRARFELVQHRGSPPEEMLADAWIWGELEFRTTTRAGLASESGGASRHVENLTVEAPGRARLHHMRVVVETGEGGTGVASSEHAPRPIEVFPRATLLDRLTTMTRGVATESDGPSERLTSSALNAVLPAITAGTPCVRSLMIEASGVTGGGEPFSRRIIAQQLVLVPRRTWRRQSRRRRSERLIAAHVAVARFDGKNDLVALSLVGPTDRSRLVRVPDRNLARMLAELISEPDLDGLRFGVRGDTLTRIVILLPRMAERTNGKNR